ncbi:ATP-binding protein [Streptomyces chartreusis]
MSAPLSRLSTDTVLPRQRGRLTHTRPASCSTPDWRLELGISTADFAARSFTCDPGSFKTVRRFILETISAWELNALADDLTTVVNELPTNALQHALPGPGDGQPKGCLGIARTGSAVVCAVSDPSYTPPVCVRPPLLADTGRGLLIVDALTTRWGYAAASPQGKTVWARISSPSI